MVTTYITGTLIALSPLTINVHPYAVCLLHSDNVHHVRAVRDCRQRSEVVWVVTDGRDRKKREREREREREGQHTHAGTALIFST